MQEYISGELLPLCSAIQWSQAHFVHWL